MLLQNRSEAVVFYPSMTFYDVNARLESSAGDPEHAHFFLAICSKAALPVIESFVFVPRAANVLRERQRHIAALQHHLEKARAEVERITAHLHQQNRWALDLEREWKAAQQRIVELQNELATEQKAGLETARGYEGKIAELEEDLQQKTAWALGTERRLTGEIEELRTRFTESVTLLEATIEERSRWAATLDAQLERATAQLSGAKASRWVRLGRMFGVGPEL
jgi:hypothetical protein